MAIDYQQLKDRRFEEIVHTYTARDTMLYALGVGVGHDPLDEQALHFVYEARLNALPTLAGVLARAGVNGREADAAIRAFAS